MTIVARVALALMLGAVAAPALAAHGLAWGDTPKYQPGFAHFDYVNPAAPKGGTLNLAGFGSFDKFQAQFTAAANVWNTEDRT